MQFTGHSLPVRQSMSVPLEFFNSSHFISQFPPTRFPLITAIRMCHFLPVHHLGMAFLAGSKAKIQLYVWWRVGERAATPGITPTVKHKGSSDMVWGTFANCIVGNLHQLKGKLNQTGYHSIVQHGVISSHGSRICTHAR